MRATGLRTLSIAAMLAASASSSLVGAQDAHRETPSDVSSAVFPRERLPEVPAGFISRESDAVHWDHPAEARAGEIVDQLDAIVRIEWPRIERELGADVADELVIRVARNPDEMRALAPSEAPPPAYAVGVAYPASGLVLLTLSAPETWDRPDLAHVVVHELSHVALHRALDGRAVPRWFTEGLAIRQAHERSFERIQSLWDATVRGQLIPLDDLSRSFPARPHQVGIAYAESADFVEWLHRRGDGPAHIAELVSRIRRGQDFETAVSQTWSLGIGQLEHEWREGLAERFGAMPLLLGTGVIWFVISVLVVIAWARRKSDARRTVHRWEAEEAEEAEEARARARAQALAELRARAEAHGKAAARQSDDGDEDGAPAERDPHLPTIRWEGRDHTVH